MAKPTKAADLSLDTALLKEGAFAYRAVNNKLRQKIIQLIHKKARIIVTDIYKTLKIEQSVASQQLAILRSQELVNSEREGKRIWYSVNYQKLNKLHKAAEVLNSITGE